MKGIMERVDLQWGELPFGYRKTDGHIQYRFREKTGRWDSGKIVKSDKISIGIASTCLHYGQECFEGLKAFETRDGRVLAFRPVENARRMQRTADKIVMIAPPDEVFIQAVERAVRLNRRFIPPYGCGASLYLRPLLIGTSNLIGVRPSKEYLFIAFATPVGPYFKGEMKGIKLMAMEEVDRAATYGLGDAKTGGNYAAGLRGMYAARDKGFNEALYLDSREHKYIEETGASNVFGITRDGRYVTPKSGSILPSITNRSLMEIARDLGMKVEQRPMHVDELPEFVEFGAVGTAAVITPVHAIGYRDRVIKFGDENSMGPVSQRLFGQLTGIQCGDIEDTRGWTHEISID